MASDSLHHPHVHDPAIGEIPVPHGPDTGEAEASYPYTHNAENEKEIFSYLLHPDDSYTPEGVYWADLPLGKRFAFVSKVNGEESSKEWKWIWEMTKEDPLSPVGWYFRHAVLPGAGLGLEGYVISFCYIPVTRLTYLSPKFISKFETALFSSIPNKFPCLV